MNETILLICLFLLLALAASEAVIICRLIRINQKISAGSVHVPAELFHSAPEDVTEEDIMSMVKEGHEQGILEESEADMISNIFAFDDKEAKDIMIHRSNIIFIDGETTLEESIRDLAECGRSRLPVFNESTDNVIGVLHIKDVLACSLHEELSGKCIRDIPELMRPADFIPETLGINNLFRRMQKDRNHLAMVVDEYGQISGMVAMEDILEEIVGNIEDEHDNDEKHIRRLPSGSWLIDGLTEFSEVCDALQLEADPESYDTLNGFLIAKLDRIPEDGRKETVEACGYRFEILKTQNRIIQKVAAVQLPQSKTDGSATDACM